MKNTLCTVAIFLCAIFVFVSCDNPPQVSLTEQPATKHPSTTSTTPTQSTKDVLYLSNLSLEDLFEENPSPEKLIAQMANNGITVTGGEREDPESYYRYSLNISTFAVSFRYSNNIDLMELAVYGENAPTTNLGIGIGDSKERVIYVYGDDYKEATVYLTFTYLEYRIGDAYLMFSLENDKLRAWYILSSSEIDLQVESEM